MTHPTGADPVGRSTWIDALGLFGLAAFALAFPLVRLLVDAPEFFIAHDVSEVGTVAFFVIAIVLVPATIALLGTLPGRFGRVLAAVLLGFVSCLALAAVLQPISGASALFTVAVVVGAVAIVVWDRRSPAFRSTAALLALLPVVLLAWVLGPSRVGSYIRSTDAGVVDQEATVDADTPVIVVVLDEVSIVPFLGSDLEINAERFPNVAALAETSHWFRHASSVSPQTSASVPALLSGVEPDTDKVPVSADHPTNIFLQLGNLFEVHAYEPITSLCPEAVCDADRSGASTADASGEDERRSGPGPLVEDAWVVYRHAVGSDAVREDLPSINQGWAGFGDGNIEVAAADEGADVKHGGYGTFPEQARRLVAIADTEAATDRPQLWVTHLVAPHLPWVSLPDGSTYDGTGVDGLAAQDGTLTWTSDGAARRAGYQRYLLQLGALDRAIGQMRARLTEQGIWDDALVVVTADHGVQFQPGGSRAVGPGGAEVTAVPFFVKEPGQTRGEIDDRSVLTIDLLPTLLGRLGIRSPSSFDGLDVFADRVPKRRTGGFTVAPGDRITPDQTDDALRAAVERRSVWFDADGGWDVVYQPGISEELVGRPVEELGPAGSSGTWQRAAGEQGPRITAVPAGRADGTVLVVCDDVVAGAARAHEDDPVVVFASPDHCADPDAGELWFLDAGGTLRRPRRTS